MDRRDDILNRYFDQTRQQPSLLSTDEVRNLIASPTPGESEGAASHFPRLNWKVTGVVATLLVASLSVLFIVAEPQKDDPVARTNESPSLLATLPTMEDQGEDVSGAETSAAVPEREVVPSRRSRVLPRTVAGNAINNLVSKHLSEAGPAIAEASTIVNESDSIQSQPVDNNLRSNDQPSLVPTTTRPTFMQAVTTPQRIDLPELPKISQSIIVTGLDDLNTGSEEYNPMISADGRTLYFVSNNVNGLGGHDIWMATRRGEYNPPKFTPPLNLGSSINSALNEGAATISVDGRTMYYTSCGRTDGVGDCDLYEARLEEEGWVEVRNVRELNSGDWEGQPTLSSDGRTLCFVSNRPGALGGRDDADIYISTKNSDGTWSAPKNIGRPINTKEREDSPFIVAGGDALYFSSRGHHGVGGFDFYVSRRQADGSWGNPENLKGLNTPADERFIAVPASENIVYYAAQSKGGRLDLYSAQLGVPSSTTVVKGKIVNRENPTPLAGELLFVDHATGSILSTAGTSEITGEYSFVLNGAAGSRRQEIDIYGVADSLGPFRGTLRLEPTRSYREVQCDLILSPSDASVDMTTGTDLPVVWNDQKTEVTVESALSGPARLELLDSWGHVLESRMVQPDETIRVGVGKLTGGLYLLRVGEKTTLLSIGQKG